MPNGPPILLTLHKFFQHGLQRLSSNSSGSGQQSSSFHEWCHVAQPQQTCHTALELHEVLIQVFKHLDSRSLTTTIPLVCQHWKAAAACDQIWKPRCDPQLLAAVQQQTPGAAAPDTFLSLSSDASSTAVATLSTQVAAVRSLTTANNPATAAVKPHYTVALPLLHHAVHSFNLLRNPLFSAAVNADYSSSLLRCRSGGSSSNGGSGKAPAVLTSEQRKFAWVTTVGSPTWEAAPAGAGHAAGLQPPTPLRHPATPANGSSSRLQDWLFGRTNNTTSALPLPATSGSSSGGGDSSSTGDSSRSVFGGDARPAERQGASSWLATGSNWAEVVQVIDLMGELTARGLDAATAATILDAGILAMALSFWVEAEAPEISTNSQSKPTLTMKSPANFCAANGQAAAAAARPGPPSPAAAAAVGLPGQSPAQFAAALMLDGGQVPLRSFQTFVHTDSSHHFFSKRLAVDPADGWRRYAYVVPCCPKGLRRAVVLLRGRGTGPGSNAAAAAAVAAGSHGSSSGGANGGVRFACAQLNFIRRDEVEGLGAEECLEGWQDRVVQGF